MSTKNRNTRPAGTGSGAQIKLDMVSNFTGLCTEKEYDKAIEELTILGDFKDSKEKIAEIQKAKDENNYLQAEQLLKEGKYSDALIFYNDSIDYLDSSEKIGICISEITDEGSANVAEELSVLSSVPDEYYTSHKEYAYMYGQALINASEWSLAEKYFGLCKDYESAKKYITYAKAKSAIEDGDTEDAITLLSTISGFIDSDSIISNIYYQEVISSEKIMVEDAVERLSLAPELEGKGKELFDICTELEKCSGEYRSTQKKSTSRFNIYFELIKGKCYATVEDSFLVDPERWGYLQNLQVFKASNYDTSFKYLIYTINNHGTIFFSSGRAMYVDESGKWVEEFLKIN